MPRSPSRTRIAILPDDVAHAKARRIRIGKVDLYPPLTITFPPDNYATGRPLISVEGSAYRRDKIALTIGGQRSSSTTADPTGKFSFPRILLPDRRNRLVLADLSAEARQQTACARVTLTVVFDANQSPYAGRYDPLTKTELVDTPMVAIVRCGSCHDYILKDTWVETGGCCQCGRNTYSTWEQDRFWESEV